MKSKPAYKELEEELLSLKISNNLIGKSPMVRFIWKNQENWPIEYVSENVKHIFGYSVDDFIKKNIVYSEIIFPEDLLRVENEVITQSKTGLSSIEHEPYRIITKAGKIKWLNDITLIRRNKNNEITHFEGIIIDITNQKETEKALIESELRWKFAIEGNSDGMWDWNLITNKVFFSTQWKKMLGFSENEISGCLKEWDKRVHPDDKEKVYQDINKHKNGETYFYENEHRLLCKNNTYKWILDRGKIISYNSDNKPERMIGTLSDISRRKKAEQALKESEDSLSKTLMVANDGMWDWNLITNKVYFDPQYYKMAGYVADEFPSEFDEFKKRVHSDDIEDVMVQVQQHLEGKSARFNIEFRFKRKSGDWLWIMGRGLIVERDKNNKPLRFIGTHTDITERKKAELALTESEEKFQTIANFAYDWEYWISPQNEFIYISPSCERITGYSPDEFKQNPELLTSIAHPEDLDKIVDHNHKVLDNNEIETIEFRIITKKGEERWIGHVCLTIFNDNGVNIGIRGSNRDITEKKLAESALQESEEKYRSLTENINVGIYRNIPGKHGKFIELNNAMLKMFGYQDRQELFTKNVSDLYQDSVERSKFNIKLNDNDFVKNEELKLRKKDGTKIICTVSASAVKDENGKIIHFDGIIEDITHRKQMEEDLQESETNLRALFHTMTDAVFELDYDGRYINIAPTSQVPMFKPSEEMMGKTMHEVLPKSDADKFLNFLRRCLDENKTISLDYSLIIENKTIWFEGRATPKTKSSVLFIAHDITKRKQMENALKESKQKYESMILNSPDLIMSQNTNGKIEYASPQCEEILGYTTEEIMNIDVSKLIHPDDLEKTKKTESTALGGAELNCFEYRFIKKNGDVVWLNHNARPIIIDGKITEVLSMVRDITKHKLDTEALKESEIQLRELNTTKDKFFSIIAHDLRSPFNTMLGYSEILNENYDEYTTEKKKRFIEIIYAGLQNTLKLLENLLQWSLSQRGVIVFNPENINLFLKVKEISDLLNQSAENKSIQLINQITENIYVEADGDMLATIIRNLLSNAIKYTHKYGEITIKTFLISNENNIQYVGISVSDNGVGIPKEMQSKLFDIGESTSTKGTENEKGTGLGLILCKEFVEKHGGKIWVESEVDKGSTFYFTIPNI